MADVRLTFVTDGGKPIGNAKVSLQQTSHDFLFGCAFPTWHRGNQESEDRFKELFRILFNCMTTETALKWRALEPRKGQLNWKAADRMIDWAETAGIVAKGHPLVWGNGPKGSGVPRWMLSKPSRKIGRYLHKRVKKVVERYAGRLRYWDVINEPCHATWFEEQLGPDYMKNVLDYVREVDPEAKLLINEYNIIGFDREMEQLVDLIKDLQEQGAPLDGVGLQAHPGSRWLRADEITRACDRIGELGLEAHITELTVPLENQPIKGRPEGGVWDEEAQAEYFEMFFRTAFAHPSVKAITVWGLWDGMIWQSNGGLVRKDFSLRPVFEVLDNLINREWRTACTIETDARGECVLMGYLGEYQVEAEVSGKRCVGTFHLDGRDEAVTVALN
ncbi:MAG: endo-1,4-beta-xylanase [Planctomycetes bacterium]|nr:endo-1,4-beta-xylanase [Planctomycetota bacterium]